MAGPQAGAPLLQLPPLQIPPPPGAGQVVMHMVHPPNNPLLPGQPNQRGPPPPPLPILTDGNLGSLMDLSNFKVLAYMKGTSTCVTLLKPNGPWIQLPNEFVESIVHATRGIPVHELILKYHQLRSLPTNLGELGSLCELELSYNCLEVIPAVLCQLHQLQQLHLQHNSISVVPESMGTDLGKLQALHMQHNKLTELPVGICRSTSLQFLDVDNNQIQSFSEEIKNMKNLKQLHAACNILEALPTSLHTLCNLEELYLSNNHIQQIHDISKMSSLKQLHLANNRLQFLPACIAIMSQLQGLTLMGNPLRFPPLSACRGGVKHLQHYMLEKMEKSVVDLGQGDAVITNLYYTGSDYELETANDSPFEDIEM